MIGLGSVASRGPFVEHQQFGYFACRCLHWSERQDHLAGALGAALADHFKASRWIERHKHSRVVRITPLGIDGFTRLGLPPG